MNSVTEEPQINNDHLQKRVEQIISRLSNEKKQTGESWQSLKLSDLQSGHEIFNLSMEEKIAVIDFLYEQVSGIYEEGYNNGEDYVDWILDGSEDIQDTLGLADCILADLLKEELTFSSEQLEVILDDVSLILDYIATRGWFDFDHSHLPLLLNHISKIKADHTLTPDLEKYLHDLANLINNHQSNQDHIKVLFKIEELLDLIHPADLNPGEFWSEIAGTDLQNFDEDQQQHWIRFFSHTEKLSGAKPSQKWLYKTEDYIDKIGKNDFSQYILKWLTEAKKVKDQPSPFFDERNTEFLKGMIWSTSLIADKNTGMVLRQLAEVCYKKIPGYGAISTKLGNACISALSHLSIDEGVAHLSYLSVKIKYKQVKSLIDKSLTKLAQNNNISRHDLEEIALPDYGLEQGIYKQTFGSFIGEIKIERYITTGMTWISDKGKAQKTVPAAIKEDYHQEIKEFKKHYKEIQKALSINLHRLENLYTADHQWSYQDWRQRYIDHPLIHSICQNLIWSFSRNEKRSLGIIRGAEIVDVHHQRIEWLDEQIHVSLWHPIMSDQQELKSWHDFLFQHHIIQPFKQAFRETYRVKDAEKETELYSNRFAAHILKQNRLNDLCRERGWTQGIYEGFESYYTPTKFLRDWNLRAEIWLNTIEKPANQQNSFKYEYVSTDQLRFYQGNSDENPLPLTQIPDIIFSEVMRDIDLLINQSSIGNNPEWQDDAGEPIFQRYWQDFNFGALTLTGLNRKKLLTELIPKLKIADQCRFEDRFLIIEGQVKTYKIHIGSANVLMEPYDDNLFILQDIENANDKQMIILPLDGDNILALILNKAFLLAEDQKIKDPTIISQINRDQ